MSWQMVKLGDVCQIVSGATPKTSVKEYWGDDYYWATPKDLSKLESQEINKTERKITKLGLKSCSSSVLPINSVLFSSRAPIGLVAINTIPIATNQGFKSFIPNSGKLISKYLYYWLDANRASINEMGVGATFKEVSKVIVSKIQIALPPLAEQTRIATILDKANEIKAKRELALAKLDDLEQSTFVEMFGNTLTNPKNFERKKLSDLINFEGGSQPPASTFQYEESNENIRLVQIRDFRTDKFKTYIPKILNKRFFNTDDIMIGRYGPPVFQIFRGLSGSYNVALMKANPKLDISKNFIFYLLNEFYLHNFVVKNSERTAGQSGVNLELLEKYNAFLPPKELQIKFDKVINSIITNKKNLKTNYQISSSLVSSLQNQAFTTGFNE